MLRAALLSLTLLVSCTVAANPPEGGGGGPAQQPGGNVGDSTPANTAVNPSPPAPAAPIPMWWHVTGKHKADVPFPGAPFKSDVAFLYEHDAGFYPRFYDGKPDHGGLPQNANIPAHLAELARDIQRDIPDPNFSGWAVLDYESWDPVWELTKPEYREASLALVRSKSPGRPEHDVERLAKATYESAAKKFMLETIKEAKRQRPRAKWGYYALPWPTYAVHQTSTQWLWDASDALYPCLYAYKQGLPASADKIGPDQREISVTKSDMRGRIALCKRFAPDKPIIALLWVRYDGIGTPIFGQFVNDLDLQTMLKIPAESGADGLIFWNQSQTPAEATDLNRFVRARLMPEVRNAD